RLASRPIQRHLPRPRPQRDAQVHPVHVRHRQRRTHHRQRQPQPRPPCSHWTPPYTPGEVTNARELTTEGLRRGEHAHAGIFLFATRRGPGAWATISEWWPNPHEDYTIGCVILHDPFFFDRTIQCGRIAARVSKAGRIGRSAEEAHPRRSVRTGDAEAFREQGIGFLPDPI